MPETLIINNKHDLSAYASVSTPVTILQVSCNCVGCSSGPPSCSAPVGEVLPSAAPAPALVTADNLSVPR